jgi:hypothetical protein
MRTSDAQRSVTVLPLGGTSMSGNAWSTRVTPRVPRLSRLHRWVGVGCIALVLAGLLPPAVAAAPTATWTWSRPQRYTDTNGDGLRDPRNTASLVSAPFTVAVNACASTGDGQELRYEWRSSGSTNVDTSSCQGTLSFANEGTFSVTLTVVTSGGARASSTQTVTVNDLLIVSLGDSFASGEGNPHSYGLFDGFIPLPVNVKWGDDVPALSGDKSQCHRSAYAGSALAAAWLEEKDPRTSVTFVHLACSGAKIEDQTLWGDYAGMMRYHKEGGLLDPYRGVNVPTGSGVGDRRPQVDEAATVTGTRTVDAMTVSIGGNDVHFASIIKDCMIDREGCDVPDTPNPTQPADDPGFCGSQLGDGRCSGVDVFNEQIARLPARFDRLADRLTESFGSRLAPERLLLLEYPSQTRCDDGKVCPIMDPVISLKETTWADTAVLPRLNGVLKTKATEHGWTYVDGISAGFEGPAGHGYAADDSWFIGLGRSFAQQAGKDGAFHPNRAGQRWYRNRILHYLGQQLAPATPKPPANVGSDRWGGGPFDDIDLSTDRDGDLIIDLFDNCPMVVNVDQKDSNDQGAKLRKDGLGDACGNLVVNGGVDDFEDDGTCDTDGPKGEPDGTPCSIPAILQERLSGRAVFERPGAYSVSSARMSSPLVEAALIVDGTATPIQGAELFRHVDLPAPRCHALLGKPCVQLEGGLTFWGSAANGSEVTGVDIPSHSRWGLWFDRVTSGAVYGNRIGTLSPTSIAPGPGLELRHSSIRVGGTRAWERNTFAGNETGILISYNAAGTARNRIVNNYIGTDPKGRTRVPNTNGIEVVSSGPRIEGNVIAGNTENGIWLNLPSQDSSGKDIGAAIAGNRIGLNVNNAALGNGHFGVYLHSSNGHTVGGTAASAANRIAHNGRGGIQNQGARRNRFLGNLIWANASKQWPGALGINVAHDQLDDDEPTPDDRPDEDGIQNRPIVYQVEPVDGQTRITTRIDSRPSTRFRIEYFANAGSCEPQRYGEGQTFLGAKDVTTDTTGRTAFTFMVPRVLGLTERVTATATNPEGDTSEFSLAHKRDGRCTSTFVVNSIGDRDDGDTHDGRCDTGTSASGFTGICTLRAALTQANGVAGHDTISFRIGTGVVTITPQTALPEITEPVFIDGHTQPGTARPLVRVDGHVARGDGLTVRAAGTWIRGLSLTRWPGTAITVQNAPMTWIRGNHVGLLPDGTTVAGNGYGVYMASSANSTIGGLTVADRNVISGNSVGIWLQGSESNERIFVQGNHVGTNAGGTAARGNTTTGISAGSERALIGGTTSAARNVISGNGGDGIRVSAAVEVSGNHIGTNAAGTGPIPNGGDGVELAALPGALVGGPGPGAGNVIAFNRQRGISGWAGTELRRNSLFSNEWEAISLAPSGTVRVLDAPVLTSATPAGRVTGRVTARPGQYAVEIFGSPRPCTAATEARTYLGSVTVTVPSGETSAAFAATLGALPAGSVLTATSSAISGAGPGTSQLSACLDPDTSAPAVTRPVPSFAVGSTLGSPAVPVLVSWSGSDGVAGSGVARYRLQQRIDDGSWTEVALPTPTTRFVSRLLAPGHRYAFRVRATDRWSNVSAWAESTALMLAASQEAAFSFSGTWFTRHSPAAYGGAYRQTSTGGATAKVTVTGRALGWVAATGPDRGKADVYIDGVKVATVDLYSATQQPRKVVFTRAWPTSASRVLQVRALGTRRTASIGNAVDVDAVASLR